MKTSKSTFVKSVESLYQSTSCFHISKTTWKKGQRRLGSMMKKRRRLIFKPERQKNQKPGVPFATSMSLQPNSNNT